MTFLEFAEKILIEVRRPMSHNEIWEYGLKKNYIELLGSQGKTPKATLGAQLHVMSKEGKNSSFGYVGSRPKKFILKEFHYSKDDLIEEDREVTGEVENKSNSYSESDLHRVLVYFIYFHLNCYSKTLNHQKSSKKDFGEWVHPDIVGCYFPIENFKSEVNDLSAIMGNLQVSLLSFELKKQLNFGNLRYSFFQAVSNSSWANESYLVAADISDDPEFRKELSRLSNSFGIGVIELDLEDPDASDIIFPAEERESIDWETVNKLTINPDFNEFLKRVKRDIEVKEIRKEWYDKVETRESIIEYFQNKIKIKGILK